MTDYLCRFTARKGKRKAVLFSSPSGDQFKITYFSRDEQREWQIKGIEYYVSRDAAIERADWWVKR